MRTISKRSRFLTALAALGAPGILPAKARAAQFEFKLALTDPEDYPSTVRLAQMAKAVATETNGRMLIKLFPNSVLGSSASMLTQLRLGIVQMFATNHYGFSPLIPAIQIDSVGFAFANENQPVQILDGELGGYLHREFAAKGLFLFDRTFDIGFRQVTSSTKPIRTAGDFADFKIRVPPAPIYVDLFKTLGAAPVPIDAAQLYTSLQTKLADGQEVSLNGLETYRTYEVQKYVSVTNHLWVGVFVAANAEAWNAVPADIQEAVKRNTVKFTLQERKEIRFINTALADKLRRQGLTFFTADTAGMRSRLGPYYAKWKSELGNTAWGLLEAGVGRLA